MQMPGFTNTFGVLSQMAALHAIREDERRQARMEREAEMAAYYAAAADGLVGEARELLALVDALDDEDEDDGAVAWDDWT